MTPAAYRRERKRLCSAIDRLVKPHLLSSGYRCGPIGNSTALLVWVPHLKNGKPSLQTFRLRGGFVVNEFRGFVPGGIIADYDGGWLVKTDFEDVPVEDLFRLEAWERRRFAPAVATSRAR